MKKYEIINPSDECYLYAESDNVAAVCGILLGSGMYGIKDTVTGELVQPLFSAELKDGTDTDKFITENKKAIKDCLKTFEYADERSSLNDIGARAKKIADLIKV